MADVNKAAQLQADTDHKSGSSSPNTSTWDHGARDAYETQRAWLKRQEDAKKP